MTAPASGPLHVTLLAEPRMSPVRLASPEATMAAAGGECGGDRQANGRARAGRHRDGRGKRCGHPWEPGRRPSRHNTLLNRACPNRRALYDSHAETLALEKPG